MEKIPPKKSKRLDQMEQENGWSHFLPFSSGPSKLPPIPEVGYPIFLEIRNPWGKVVKRRGLKIKKIKNTINKRCKIAAHFL